MSETRNALIFIREQLGSFISVTQISDLILCSGNEQLHTFISTMNSTPDVCKCSEMISLTDWRIFATTWENNDKKYVTLCRSYDRKAKIKSKVISPP